MYGEKIPVKWELIVIELAIIRTYLYKYGLIINHYIKVLLKPFDFHNFILIQSATMAFKQQHRSVYLAYSNVEKEKRGKNYGFYLLTIKVNDLFYLNTDRLYIFYQKQKFDVTCMEFHVKFFLGFEKGQNR